MKARRWSRRWRGGAEPGQQQERTELAIAALRSGNDSHQRVADGTGGGAQGERNQIYFYGAGHRTVVGFIN